MEIESRYNFPFERRDLVHPNIVGFYGMTPDTDVPIMVSLAPPSPPYFLLRLSISLSVSLPLPLPAPPPPPCSDPPPTLCLCLFRPPAPHPMIVSACRVTELPVCLSSLLSSRLHFVPLCLLAHLSDCDLLLAIPPTRLRDAS